MQIRRRGFMASLAGLVAGLGATKSQQSDSDLTLASRGAGRGGEVLIRQHMPTPDPVVLNSSKPHDDDYLRIDTMDGTEKVAPVAQAGHVCVIDGVMMYSDGVSWRRM